ncbi:hypothetical protein ACET3X_005184 [Alternaria dauci]|uniref:Uncharacterized protein n=1 Tax=Alternaria dauci TaxID=48095 RepID=A0ABR3UJZ3_9PLEO
MRRPRIGLICGPLRGLASERAHCLNRSRIVRPPAAWNLDSSLTGGVSRSKPRSTRPPPSARRLIELSPLIGTPRLSP